MNRACTQLSLKLYFLLFLFVGLFSFSASALITGNDVISDITNALKSANTADIVKYMGNSIDINICSTDETCNKVSAEKALKNFFAQNPPQSFTLKHQGASKDGGKYAVGILNAGGKNYRVNIMLKQSGTELQLQSIEITKE